MFSVRYLMYQCIPRIRKSLELLILLTSCDLTTCYKKFLIAVFAVARHTNQNYQTFQSSGIYLLKVNSRNTITKCEIYLKLTIKTPERSQLSSLQCLYCQLYTNFATCLVFVFLTLNMQLFAGQLFYFCKETHRQAAMRNSSEK